MKIVNCLCTKLTVKPTEFDVYVFIVSGVILGRKQYVSHLQQKKWIPLKMKGKKSTLSKWSTERWCNPVSSRYWSKRCNKLNNFSFGNVR